MLGLKQGTVRLAAYDPEWPRLFETEKTLLCSLLGPRLLAIEHIGSTSIPGMPAKPIIDIMIVLRSFAEAEAALPTLAAAGYEHIPDEPVPDRLFLAKGVPECRTHHLSLTESGTRFAEEQIFFRDYVCAHPETADEYRKLKQGLAAAHPDDRPSYTQGKDELVRRVLKLAETQQRAEG